MQISSEIQNRIIDSAEQLYAQHPERLPTVADVRALSKADMNSVSTVMKQWRQGKLMPQRSIEEDAPVEIQNEAQVLAASLWSIAKDQAEQKLHEAEARYSKEREDAEQLRLELSLECDSLQKTIEEQAEVIVQLQQMQQQAAFELNQAQVSIAQLQAEKSQIQHQEALATAKNVELEKHVATLKADLEHDQAKTAADAQAHQQTVLELQQALAELQTAKAVTKQAQKHAQDLQAINAGLLKLGK